MKDEGRLIRAISYLARWFVYIVATCVGCCATAMHWVCRDECDAHRATVLEPSPRSNYQFNAEDDEKDEQLSPTEVSFLGETRTVYNRIHDWFHAVCEPTSRRQHPRTFGELGANCARFVFRVIAYVVWMVWHVTMRFYASILYGIADSTSTRFPNVSEFVANIGGVANGLGTLDVWLSAFCTLNDVFVARWTDVAIGPSEVSEEYYEADGVVTWWEMCTHLLFRAMAAASLCIVGVIGIGRRLAVFGRKITKGGPTVKRGVRVLLYVHGLMGWDSNGSKLLGEYWGGRPSGLYKDEDDGCEVLTVGYCSVMTTEHSARQLFYKIKGGKYKPPTGTAALEIKGAKPNWSADNPLDIAAHSLGCCVVLKMHQMMVEGAFGKLDRPKEWIGKFTSFNAPFKGATVANAMYHPDGRMLNKWFNRFVVASIGAMARLNETLPWTLSVWDANMQGTALARRPIYPLLTIQEVNAKYSELITAADMTFANSIDTHDKATFYSNVEYSVYVAKCPYWTIFGYNIPVSFDAILWFVWAVRRDVGAWYTDVPDDGIVDAISATGRFTEDAALAKRTPHYHLATIRDVVGTHWDVMQSTGPGVAHTMSLLDDAEYSRATRSKTAAVTLKK